MKKSILCGLAALSGAAAGAAAVSKVMKKTVDEKQMMSEKHLSLFLMLNRWLMIKQEGKRLDSFFEERKYRKIAIYGMSYVGERLFDELRGTSVEVVYGIDKNPAVLYAGLEVVSAEEELEEVDAIVVTAVTFFDEIEEKLSAKIDCPIISLEDIIFGI